MTKAQTLLYLFYKEPVSKGEIIGRFSKQSSKGIYRHIRDLEHEKIVRTSKSKGAVPVCKLNKSLDSLAKVLDYLFAVRGIKEAFDRAFAECFTSPYGDFHYAYFTETSLAGKGWYQEALEAIGDDIFHKNRRPSFTGKQIARINRVAEMVRGPMDTSYKLAYMGLVYGIFSITEGQFNSSMVLSCTAYHSRKEIVKLLQGKPDLADFEVSSAYATLGRILEIWKDKELNGIETHFMGEVTEREKNIAGIMKASLSVQLLTVKDFMDRSPIFEMALKGVIPES